MGEITYHSVIMGIIVFAIVAIGGAVVLNDSFNEYAITDNNTLNNSNFRALNDSVDKLRTDAELTNVSITGIGVIDDGMLAIYKVVKVLGGVKDIFLNIQNAISSIIGIIVPAWLIGLIFSIIFITLVILGIRTWLKITP
jgi:hypothetical protein|tara:strand:- start:6462 stop:6881 length:420 start_codon:yes stop_codon:yes gene_type:complete